MIRLGIDNGLNDGIVALDGTTGILTCNIRIIRLHGMKRIPRSFTSLLLPVLLAFASTALSAPLSPQQFVQKVAQVDMLEIALGKVAQKNSNHRDVKDFGFYMVKSHTDINDMLVKSAAKQKIAVPNTLDASGEATLKKLSGLHGKTFDITYIPAMVKGHKGVLLMLKKFTATTSDPVLKKFAMDITPIIAMHLHHAEMVLDEMKKDGEL